MPLQCKHALISIISVIWQTSSLELASSRAELSTPCLQNPIKISIADVCYGEFQIQRVNYEIAKRFEGLEIQTRPPRSELLCLHEQLHKIVESKNSAEVSSDH